MFKNNYVYCFWDFELNPISFDIIWFLAACDHYAKKIGYQNISISFIPEFDKEKRKYPKNYDQIIDYNSREWRKKNICFDATSLFPRIKEINISNDREKILNCRNELFNFLESNFDDQDNKPILFPFDLNSVGHWEYYKYINQNINNNEKNWGIKPSIQSIRYVEDWFKLNQIDPAKTITLTFRQLEVDKQRNNKIDEWFKFAEYLKSINYFPLVVPDSDYIFKENYGFSKKNYTFFEHHAFNLELRAALYAKSKINFFTSSGPASLCQMNPDTNYVVTDIIDKSDKFYGKSREFLELKSFVVDKNPSFCNSRQIFHWENSNCDQLIKLLNDVIKNI